MSMKRGRNSPILRGSSASGGKTGKAKGKRGLCLRLA